MAQRLLKKPSAYSTLICQQDDTDVDSRILNVSFSAKRPDVPGEEFYQPQFLRERVYLHRASLAKLATVTVSFYPFLPVLLFTSSFIVNFDATLRYDISRSYSVIVGHM